MSHFMVCGNLFEVQAKYTPIKPIGKGAYGVVWCVCDSPAGEVKKRCVVATSPGLSPGTFGLPVQYRCGFF